MAACAHVCRARKIHHTVCAGCCLVCRCSVSRTHARVTCFISCQKMPLGSLRLHSAGISTGISTGLVHRHGALVCWVCTSQQLGQESHVACCSNSFCCAGSKSAHRLHCTHYRRSLRMMREQTCPVLAIVTATCWPWYHYERETCQQSSGCVALNTASRYHPFHDRAHSGRKHGARPELLRRNLSIPPNR